MKKLLNRMSYRMFGKNLFKEVKFPIRANRTIRTVMPDNAPPNMSQWASDIFAERHRNYVSRY